MKEIPKLTDTQGIWDYCSANIAGFDGLIDTIQGMIVGWTIATENFISTPNYKVTHKIVSEMIAELNSMTNAWGYDK